VWLDLVGDAFYVKERNKLGVPAALWPVPPHWVAETPTPQHPFYRVSWRGWQGAIPQTEMLWLSHPNPVNPYGRGSGVAKAIDDELQADEYAARHTLAYFRNSARPDLLVMPKEGGYLDPDERDRLHTWWTDNLQGVWRRFKPLFLTRPMDVTVLQQSLRDMVLPELRQMERDLIVSVWGVTPEVIGIIGNSNRATIREARPLFATYCLTPRLERMREALQSRLVPEYDEALILDYDSVIPEDREFKLKAMQSFPWAWDGNEMRQLAGDSPEPEMDGVRMQPSAYIPFGAEPVSPTGLFPKLENLTDEELRQLYGLLSKAERKELTDATR
jgi:phage portal protein BeeE